MLGVGIASLVLIACKIIKDKYGDDNNPDNGNQDAEEIDTRYFHSYEDRYQ